MKARGYYDKAFRRRAVFVGIRPIRRRIAVGACPARLSGIAAFLACVRSSEKPAAKLYPALGDKAVLLARKSIRDQTVRRRIPAGENGVIYDFCNKKL